MRLGGQLFRSLAACGLTAAALLACGVTAHAQAVSGNPGGPGMSAGSPGAGGPLGTGPGGPGGPGITGNPSSPGSNSFAGGNTSNFLGSGGSFGGNNGASYGAPSGTGNLGGGALSGGGGGGSPSSTGGTGAILALTFYAVPVNPPSSAPPLPARLSPELRDLLSRSDSISAETARDMTVAYDVGGTLVLRGTVASPAEGRAVESLIRFAPGVTGVHNEMRPRRP